MISYSITKIMHKLGSFIAYLIFNTNESSILLFLIKSVFRLMISAIPAYIGILFILHGNLNEIILPIIIGVCFIIFAIYMFSVFTIRSIKSLILLKRMS